MKSKNIYHLPFKRQINIHPAPYHFEETWLRNSVDFALDIGTPILATKEGLVHEVIDGYGKGGLDKKFLPKVNMIIIEHDNGEFSAYAHLQKGILVKENQEIKTGRIIGYSGVSGYHSYPHLHYNTMIQKNWDWLTIPTRFLINGKIKTLVSPKK